MGFILPHPSGIQKPSGWPIVAPIVVIVFRIQCDERGIVLAYPLYFKLRSTVCVEAVGRRTGITFQVDTRQSE
jgi:hypothetical protein